MNFLWDVLFMALCGVHETHFAIWLNVVPGRYIMIRYALSNCSYRTDLKGLWRLCLLSNLRMQKDVGHNVI